jgi:hypothetical protein
MNQQERQELRNQMLELNKNQTHYKDCSKTHLTCRIIRTIDDYEFDLNMIDLTDIMEEQGAPDWAKTVSGNILDIRDAAQARLEEKEIPINWAGGK